MPLPATEPNVQVRDLLVQKWTGNSITVDETFDTAWIGTGWWDEQTPNPQITLTNFSDPTDPNGLTPKGLSSWVDGTGQCDVWVPYDGDEYDSRGAAKGLRWDLTRKVHSIIENNQEAADTADLTRLETGTIERNPAEDPPPFRMFIPIGFQYRTAPK